MDIVYQIMIHHDSLGVAIIADFTDKNRVRNLIHDPSDELFITNYDTPQFFRVALLADFTDNNRDSNLIPDPFHGLFITNYDTPQFFRSGYICRLHWQEPGQ